MEERLRIGIYVRRKDGYRSEEMAEHPFAYIGYSDRYATSVAYYFGGPAYRHPPLSTESCWNVSGDDHEHLKASRYNALMTRVYQGTIT